LPISASMDSRLTLPGNRLDQRKRRRLPAVGFVIAGGRCQAARRAPAKSRPNHRTVTDARCR
jgi:hypothetical protein